MFIIFKKSKTIYFFCLFINLIKAAQEEIHNLAIIGSGPAGLTAAICASQFQLNPVVIEGNEVGENLKANIIKNWPMMKPISYNNLTKCMKYRAQKKGTRFIQGPVTEVNFFKKPFTIFTGTNKIYANSVIIATGAKPIKLGCYGEEDYLGKGIAVCARCDAPLFKDKSIVVIGGNQFALREVELLTKIVKDIKIINKHNDINADLKLTKKIKENPKVEILNNTKVLQIVGNDKFITGIKILRNNKVEFLPTQGIFIAIGWQPDSEIFKGQLARDSKRRIKLRNDTNTSIDGIFAAGDVTTKTRHQAYIASAYGCMAAMDAEKYLRKYKFI